MKNYEGKFIAGYISYEYGVNLLGVSVKKSKQMPAVHFRAYDSYEKHHQITSGNNDIKWTSFKPQISTDEYKFNFNEFSNISSSVIYLVLDITFLI